MSTFKNNSWNEIEAQELIDAALWLKGAGLSAVTSFHSGSKY